jgi:hypothetical protein
MTDRNLLPKLFAGRPEQRLLLTEQSIKYRRVRLLCQDLPPSSNNNVVITVAVFLAKPMRCTTSASQ